MTETTCEQGFPEDAGPAAAHGRSRRPRPRHDTGRVAARPGGDGAPAAERRVGEGREGGASALYQKTATPTVTSVMPPMARKCPAETFSRFFHHGMTIMTPRSSARRNLMPSFMWFASDPAMP